jgi:bifunctional non-homologous end joining protein LigD
VRLYSRNGNDFGKRFPLVVAAVAALPARSCLIDGEAIVTDEVGLAVFDLLRSWRHDAEAVLCAFYLIGLDSQDFRRLWIEQRKRIRQAGARVPSGIALNEHYIGDGDIVYRQAGAHQRNPVCRWCRDVAPALYRHSQRLGFRRLLCEQA